MLALVMVFSISAVSFGEAAPVQYSSFEEHLDAFMDSLDLQKNDVFMAASMNEQTYQLLVGQDDNGVVNIMAGQNGEPVGCLQIDSEAAYLSYQNSIMAIQFATIKSFLDNLPQKLLGYLQALGIDPQQIMADLQTLMALGQKFTPKLMSAYKQSVEGNVMTMTLDAEAYANLYAEAVDELLADPALQDILARYIPMFGGQYDPDQVASAWQSVRGQMIDVMKNWQMVMTLDQSTGEMTIKADMPMPENIKMVMDFIVKTTDNAVNVSGNWAMTNGEQEYKYELAMNLEKDSFWLNFPNKGTCRFVLSQNGQEFAAMDSSFVLSEFGIPESILVTMSQQGQEIVRLQYADSTFVAYAQGQEMIFAQYKDNVFTFRAPNGEIVVRQTENDADHLVYEATVTSNGNTTTMYVTYTIALDENGAEFLQYDAKAGEQVGIIAQVMQTEKQAFSLLKDEEGINWITEDQLNSLLDQAVSSLLAQFQRR